MISLFFHLLKFNLVLFSALLNPMRPELLGGAVCSCYLLLKGYVHVRLVFSERNCDPIFAEFGEAVTEDRFPTQRKREAVTI